MKRETLIKIIKKMILTANEQTALEAKELYPFWSAKKAEGEKVSYIVGDRRQYKEKLYECIQAHSVDDEAWTPETAASMWKEITVDKWGEWIQPTGAHDAYHIGDRVIYNGKLYECILDGNAYSPDDYPQGWNEITDENI